MPAQMNDSADEVRAGRDLIRPADARLIRAAVAIYQGHHNHAAVIATAAKERKPTASGERAGLEVWVNP